MQLECSAGMPVSERVFEELKAKILNGEWAPGERLPSENELASMFMVSRTSIRRAIYKLETIGLLKVRPGGGSFVEKIHPGHLMNEMIPYLYLNSNSTSLEDVMEFRIMVEVGTIGLAAGRATAEDVEKLERCYGRMLRASADMGRYVEEDFRFHRLIAQISKNSLAEQLVRILQELFVSTILDLTHRGGISNGIKYHKLITAAMRDNDVDEAKRLMEEHLRGALSEYQLKEPAHKKKG